MPDDKSSLDKQTPTRKVSALEKHLQSVIPTEKDFKDAGLPMADVIVPDVATWIAALKQVKQTNTNTFDPIRVQIAVQRVVVSVVNQVIQSNSDSNESDVRRQAISLTPVITRRIVGT